MNLTSYGLNTSINKATKSLLKRKQSYCEQDEQAGKRFAWRIKQSETCYGNTQKYQLRRLKDLEHRIALYANYVILSRSSLKQTLLVFLRSLGFFAGYKINYAISVILFMNKNERLNPLFFSHFFNDLTKRFRLSRCGDFTYH